MEINIFTIISFILCLTYQTMLLNYATKILEGGNPRLWLHLTIGLLNTIILFVSNIPFWFLYIALMPAYVVEFKLLSKAPIRQILSGATIFVVHISSFHMIAISIFASATGIDPKSILTNFLYRQQIMIILFIVLILALQFAKNILPIRYVKRVTSTHIYSEMLSTIAFTFTIYFSIAIFIYFAFEDFPNRMQFTILVAVSMLIILYYMLMFIIKFVNLHEFKRYADELGDTYNKMQTQKETLATKIERDDLTGLFNRSFIQGLLQEYFDDKSHKFGMLFVDVNRLKYVNDTYGHDKGDKLIVCVANALRKALREEDASARIGGDEFLVILSNLENNLKIDRVIERINEIMFVYDEIEDFPVSISIGGIFVDDEIRSKGVDEAIALVDEEMRKTKAKFYAQRSRYEK